MITVSPYTKAITDATANPEDVISGKVFYNNSGRHIGTIDRSCIEHRVERTVSYSDVILTSLRGVNVAALFYMACGENTTNDTSNVIERNNDLPTINGKVIPTYVITNYSSPGSEWAGTRIDINKDISKIVSVFMDGYEFVIPLNVMKRYSYVDDVPYLCMTQFAYINEVCIFGELWDESGSSHNAYLGDCNILLRHNGSILTSMSLVIPSGSTYYQSKNTSFTYGYTYRLRRL